MDSQTTLEYINEQHEVNKGLESKIADLTKIVETLKNKMKKYELTMDELTGYFERQRDKIVDE